MILILNQFVEICKQSGLERLEELDHELAPLVVGGQEQLLLGRAGQGDLNLEQVLELVQEVLEQVVDEDALHSGHRQLVQESLITLLLERYKWIVVPVVFKVIFNLDNQVLGQRLLIVELGEQCYPLGQVLSLARVVLIVTLFQDLKEVRHNN